MSHVLSGAIGFAVRFGIGHVRDNVLLRLQVPGAELVLGGAFSHDQEAPGLVIATAWCSCR